MSTAEPHRASRAGRARKKPSVTPVVIPLHLGMVTVFLVRGKKDILVDAGMPGSARRIVAALRKRGVEPGSLALLLITHGHSDHFGGVRGLLQDLKCPVAIHEGDVEAFREGRSPESSPVGALARLVTRMAPRAPRGTLPLLEPDVILDSSFALEPYGVEGTIEHTPGHTEGSVSVFLGNGEVIVGDLLRGALLSPRSPRWPFVADDLGEIRRSISRVLDQRPTRIWTSHAGPLSADAVRAFLKRES
jgi:hydroxyacylglutathione hydrolase